MFSVFSCFITSVKLCFYFYVDDTSWFLTTGDQRKSEIVEAASRQSSGEGSFSRIQHQEVGRRRRRTVQGLLPPHGQVQESATIKTWTESRGLQLMIMFSLQMFSTYKYDLKYTDSYWGMQAHRHGPFELIWMPHIFPTHAHLTKSLFSLIDTLWFQPFPKVESCSNNIKALYSLEGLWRKEGEERHSFSFVKIFLPSCNGHPPKMSPALPHKSYICSPKSWP